ncbi:hypothetical protein OH77DRAFT_1064399 [Trametes cingulata]|nr:hypothetical protein OH77DRAFT_1064399 [Trametes cingulata]
MPSAQRGAFAGGTGGLPPEMCRLRRQFRILPWAVGQHSSGTELRYDTCRWTLRALFLTPGHHGRRLCGVIAVAGRGGSVGLSPSRISSLRCHAWGVLQVRSAPARWFRRLFPLGFEKNSRVSPPDRAHSSPRTTSGEGDASYDRYRDPALNRSRPPHHRSIAFGSASRRAYPLLPRRSRCATVRVLQRPWIHRGSAMRLY